jgi:hypothetical protein
MIKLLSAQDVRICVIQYQEGNADPRVGLAFLSGKNCYLIDGEAVATATTASIPDDLLRQIVEADRDSRLLPAIGGEPATTDAPSARRTSGMRPGPARASAEIAQSGTMTVSAPTSMFG